MDFSNLQWIKKEEAINAHDRMLDDHGGAEGIRDGGALESALERPLHRHQHDPEADLFDLAAEYGFGIACNHSFVDGNKRTALLVMKWFIEENGSKIAASDDDQLTMVANVANGRAGKDELAAWLRRNAGGRKRIFHDR